MKNSKVTLNSSGSNDQGQRKTSNIPFFTDFNIYVPKPSQKMSTNKIMEKLRLHVEYIVGNKLKVPPKKSISTPKKVTPNKLKVSLNKFI